MAKCGQRLIIKGSRWRGNARYGQPGGGRTRLCGEPASVRYTWNAERWAYNWQDVVPTPPVPTERQFRCERHAGEPTYCQDATPLV